MTTFWNTVIFAIAAVRTDVCARQGRTLKMEVTSSTEIQVPIHQTTWCHVPEDTNLQSHCYENQKPRLAVCAGQRRTLKMEVAGCFEMLLTIYHTTWHHLPENSNLHSHQCENLKHWLLVYAGQGR
jgi:hypothetical protein